MSLDTRQTMDERDRTVLERIAAYGAFTCTGGCEQRQSGQLHCMNLSRELGTSNRKIWQSLVRLVETGLLERRRDDTAHCWRFTVTAMGQQVAAQRHTPQTL